jgi:hypothetical protein
MEHLPEILIIALELCIMLVIVAAAVWIVLRVMRSGT